MRIAIWNTAFLGDAVLTLPLIQTVARIFPHAEIDLWLRRGLAPLFRAHPAIHSVIEAGKGKGEVVRQLRQARAGKYDLWVNAHPSFRSALVAGCSRAPRRIGYDTGLFSRLLHTDAVPRRFDELDEIERLLELTRPLKPQSCSTWPELVLPSDAQSRAREFMEQLPSGTAFGTSPVIGIHPGSVWATKRWPTEYYGRLAALALDAGCRVLVFAGNGEQDAAQETIEASGYENDPRLVNLAGQLGLADLAAWLGQLDCYVTNDSGPMHIAWALHTPVTALFGPTVRKLGFFPRGEHSTVLEVGSGALDCRPCGLHGPRRCPQGHHNCMRWISPEMVWEDVRGKIGL